MGRKDAHLRADELIRAEAESDLPRKTTYGRLNPRNTDMVRAKIKVGHLLQSLQDHADMKRELSMTQLKAIEILLRKAMSDAPRVIAGDADAPLMTVERVIIEVVEA